MKITTLPADECRVNIVDDLLRISRANWRRLFQQSALKLTMLVWHQMVRCSKSMNQCIADGNS